MYVTGSPSGSRTSARIVNSLPAGVAEAGVTPVFVMTGGVLSRLVDPAYAFFTA